MVSLSTKGPSREPRGRLLISCPDRPGIVAAVSGFLSDRGANILHSDQHSFGAYGGQFFMRIEFELPAFSERFPTLAEEFEAVAQRFRMTSRWSRTDQRPRLAVLFSRQDHCLQELLWRWRSGELPGEIVLVGSNHPELAPALRDWPVPFCPLPWDPEDRARSESELEDRLKEARVDLVVLARFMQILSPELVARWPGRIINIHHGFLPAFQGARAYEQAYERGVKLIGATAHYVTHELDAGPIIEQDTVRVDHRHEPEALRRIGQHIERSVLARAVTWHLEDRVLIFQNRTVVFA
jgi:formyltetrahydrofolate deformylase